MLVGQRVRVAKARHTSIIIETCPCRCSSALSSERLISLCTREYGQDPRKSVLCAIRFLCEEVSTIWSASAYPMGARGFCMSQRKIWPLYSHHTRGRKLSGSTRADQVIIFPASSLAPTKHTRSSRTRAILSACELKKPSRVGPATSWRRRANCAFVNINSHHVLCVSCSCVCVIDT